MRVASTPTSTETAPARLAMAPIERAKFLWWSVAAHLLTFTVLTLTLVPSTLTVLTLTVLTVCSSFSLAAGLMTTCRAQSAFIWRFGEGRQENTVTCNGGH